MWGQIWPWSHCAVLVRRDVCAPLCDWPLGRPLCACALTGRRAARDRCAGHVRQVGTDSAQIQHSTDSVKGNLYVVEGVIHGAFETFTLPMVCCGRMEYRNGKKNISEIYGVNLWQVRFNLI